MQTPYLNGGVRTGGRYQLRHAAGLYWLIDMDPPGGAYISPVPLNEVGAMLWRMLEGGASLEDVCARLCAEYEIPLEQARKDACDFIEQLKSMRIDLEGL